MLGVPGTYNRLGKPLWTEIEGELPLPEGPVRAGENPLNVLKPEDYLPKGVTAIAGSAPAGDMPQIALRGMAGAALEAKNWKDYAVTTGA